MHSRRTLSAILAALILLVSSSPTAHAQSDEDVFAVDVEGRSLFSLKSDARLALIMPGYTVGVTTYSGAGMFSNRAGTARPGVTAYSLRERNGVVTGFAFGALFYAGALLAATTPDATSSSTTTRTTTDNRGNRIRITEQRTSAYYDPSRNEERQRMLEGAAPGAIGVSKIRSQNFSLDVFARELQPFERFMRARGDVAGYRADFTFYTPVSSSLLFEAGLGVGRTRTFEEDVRQVTNNRYLGIPLRLIYPVGPAWFTLGWDANVFALWDLGGGGATDFFERDGVTYVEDRSSTAPIRASVDLALWRLHATLGAHLARRDLGYHASLGVRF